jgi:cytochrome c-type biogenesis protein CcmF
MIELYRHHDVSNSVYKTKGELVARTCTWLSPLILLFAIVKSRIRWIAISALIDPVDRVRRGLSVSPAVLGMAVAHLGLGMITVGITAMESRMVDRDVALAPGEQVQLGQYTFRFDGVEEVEGPNYGALRGSVTVLKDGEQNDVLFPERRSYYVSRTALAEAALGVSWRRDLLATMGEDLGGGTWSLRLQVRPLMRYIWLGAALMALGGLLATLDKRYRRRRETADADERALAPLPTLQTGEA